MGTEAFIVVWDEAETIHLTIKHYQRFCEHITIFDNYSTDATPDIARKMGCEVKQFGIKGVLSDVEYTNLKNNCWKKSTADLVIVCDADEILDFKPFEGTIARTWGWQVFSKRLPVNDWLEIKKGFHDPNYSKSICFSPKLKEINYVHGCHVCKPVGNLQYSTEVMTLFHYRNVGGYQRLIDRHASYRPRMSQHNLRWNMGSHYLYEDERRKKEWLEQMSKSVPYEKEYIR